MSQRSPGGAVKGAFGRVSLDSEEPLAAGWCPQGGDELSPVERRCQSQVPGQGRASSQGRQDVSSCSVSGSKAGVCELLGSQHGDELSKFRSLFWREKGGSATTVVSSKGPVRVTWALPPLPFLVKRFLQERMGAWMSNLRAGAAGGDEGVAQTLLEGGNAGASLIPFVQSSPRR